MARSPEETTSGSLSTCPACGKRAARRGSFTSWLLLSEICSCPPGATGAPTGIKEAKSVAAAQSTSLPDLPAVSQALTSRYDFVRKLGQDTYSSVYLARQRESGGDYAVKLLNAEVLSTAGKIEIFRQVGTELQALKHQNIVAVLEHDVPLHGAAYLLREYITGHDLATALRQCDSVPPDQALELFIQLCAALEYAHAQKVLHGNLHLSNILVGKDGTAKVADFGLSLLHPTRNESLGVPTYMSPEQCQGDQLNERSDIYSFGCIMYHVLAGHPPFTQSSAIKLILQHVNEPPQLLDIAQGGNYTSGIAAVVNKCLEKEQIDRYPSAASLRLDLIALRAGKTVSIAGKQGNGSAANQREAARAVDALVQRAHGGSNYENQLDSSLGIGRLLNRFRPSPLAAVSVGIAIGATVTALLMMLLAHH